MSGAITGRRHVDSGVREALVGRVFLTVLAVKLTLSCWPISELTSVWFAPFVDGFVRGGLSNPWQPFFEAGELKAFPYFPVMLAVFAVPMAPVTWFTDGEVGVLANFAMHLPILVADLAIYLVLHRIASLRHRRVLWLWWASPVVLTSSYLHGQLDIVPIAFLVVAVGLVTADRLRVGLLVLGLGVATKMSLLVAAPFVLLYVARRYPPVELAVGGALCALPALASILVLGDDPAFAAMVLYNDTQQVVFNLRLTLLEGHVELIVAPLALGVVFLRAAAIRRQNRDLLLLFLGIGYALFVVLVPPMPGWYMWSHPFVVYFFVRQWKASPAFYWLLAGATGALILLFHGHFLRLSGIDPALLGGPVLGDRLASAIGLPLERVFSLAVSSLDAVYVLCVVWMYALGVRTNPAFVQRRTPLLIAISGPSGAGKDTLSRLISSVLGADQTVQVDGDNHHRWERGDEAWSRYTHADPRANHLHQQLQNAAKLSRGEEVTISPYDHETGRFLAPRPADPNDYVVFCGLHSLYLKRMRALMDVRIFLDPHPDLNAHWKIKRDVAERGYTPEQVLASIEARADDTAQYIKPQAAFADIVVAYEPTTAFDVGDLHAEPELRLRLRLTHNYDLTPLAAALHAHGTVVMQSEVATDLNEQEWTIEGKATADVLERVADDVLGDLADLVPWRGGRLAAHLDGVLQLVVLIALRDCLVDVPQLGATQRAA